MSLFKLMVLNTLSMLVSNGSPEGRLWIGLHLCCQSSIYQEISTGCLPRNGYNLDIVWSGVAWTCGKQLRHYPVFYRKGLSSIISFLKKGSWRQSSFHHVPTCTNSYIYCVQGFKFSV